MFPEDRQKDMLQASPPNLYADNAPGTDLPSDPLIGQTLANRFQVLSVLGKGGMSVVYKCKHILLNKTVALKLMHPHLASDPKSLKRFRQEAQSASHLNHPNIIGIYDFGVLEDGQPFLSMDYVRGASIADLLARKGQLSAERTLCILSQACDALAHAHRKGVIHRDLKPSNIILTSEDGRCDMVKIVDFGIAKVMFREETELQDLTQTGESLGSPPYMSPEQCQGQRLDARSDIYSMGCLFYEMITGKPPLSGRTVYETIYKQINEMPESVSKSARALKDAGRLDAIILKAMAKNPAQRYQSMDEFKAAIEEIRQGERSNWLGGIRTSWELFCRKTISLPQRRAGFLGWTAAITALAVGAGIIAIWNMSRPPQVPPVPATSSSMVLPGANSSKVYEYFRLSGQKQYDSGNYAESEKMYRLALKEALRLGEQDSRYTGALEQMAVVLSKQGKTADAAAMLREAERCKKFRISFGDPDSNNRKITELNIKLQTEPSQATRQELAKTLNDQASLMYWQSRLDDSESLSAQALSLGKKLLGNNNAQVARSYLLQARAKMAQGKMAEASSDYKTGETILTKIKAPGDPMLGDGLNCLAQFYCQSGQLTKSRDFFEQALRTYETAFGKESPHAAECLDGLARIATLEKDYDRAESLYKQALSMSAKTRGESHVAVGRSLANLGWMYLQKKNYAEATDCLEQSIAIFEQNALGDSLDLSMADLYLGQSLVAKGNVAAAEPLFKRALNIAQRVEPHGKLALESFNQLVKIYRLQNRKQDIVDLLKTVQTPARGGPGHGGES